jgi:hypothetical protein
MTVTQTERRQELERHARLYARLGFAIVFTQRLDRGDAKKVTTAGWQNTAPLTNGDGGDHAAGLIATRGLTRNVAINLRTSRLIGIEVDGGDGLDQVLALDLPETLVAQSSAPDRLHWHLRPPAGLDKIEYVSFRFEGGSVLAATNNYYVSPPSIHPSGAVYRFLTGHDLDELPELPLAAYLELVALAGKTPGPNGKATGEPVTTIIPEGRRRTELLSLAGALRRKGLGEAEILASISAVNKQRCRPLLDDVELAGLAQDVPRRYQPAGPIGVPAYTGPTRALDDVVATFRKWLHLPDPGALYVTLAAVIANRLPGDPVWLLLVAASSSGKTEILFSVGGLPEVHPAATMTEAALLSGTPKKDQDAGATGGLLLKIGDYGILTCKDFGSVLSMHRDARAAVLGALREIYDGSWDRHVGVDGGRTLHWQGKLGLIAGVTSVVDSHHAVMDSLGSRFAFYRVEIDDRDAQGHRALEHRTGARTMREELRDAVSGFFAGLELPDGDTLTPADKARIVTLADLVTKARSPIERDRVSRDIELIPDPEAPARFALMLAALLDGLRILGIPDDHAWQLITKTAFDSMPAQRRRVLEHLATCETTTTKETALALGLPTTTTRRTLEDLAAHHVLVRESETGEKADTWRLSPWTQEKYAQ